MHVNSGIGLYSPALFLRPDFYLLKFIMMLCIYNPSVLAGGFLFFINMKEGHNERYDKTTGRY
ncbi:hypothetical protein HNR32_000680 [Pectinatus brassicae]|uniref:Uncharacterized protein n=1 Tax=Pectinatus brassicae TaxID=862415 RepID=A0A840URD3_9FIRM|nr:hypothetical protein [Pectinatus brassicae]MBB5335553.1 hypothetical protein [Pectinatus brassicae]